MVHNYFFRFLNLWLMFSKLENTNHQTTNTKSNAKYNKITENKKKSILASYFGLATAPHLHHKRCCPLANQRGKKNTQMTTDTGHSGPPLGLSWNKDVCPGMR